ncbi:MAG: hypothetical protein WAU91_23110, partial [Desulfatitalea sp.]
RGLLTVLNLAVSLKVPSGGDIPCRLAARALLLGVYPLNLAVIDPHCFGGKSSPQTRSQPI